jgi:pyruvate kinase
VKNKQNKIKIICTLGPSSFKRKVLNNLIKEKVDMLRINLSHTKEEEIEKRIKQLKRVGIRNLCIDTEGSQVRTRHVKQNITLKKGQKVRVYNIESTCNKKEIFLYPDFLINSVKIGTSIFIGFDDLRLRVVKKLKKKNCLICKVEKSGILGANKGVHFNQKINLPSLTLKDIKALKIGKKLGIKNFALSFVNSSEDIKKVKKIIGNKNFVISKIETYDAVKNLVSISKNSNALLIDRGDLSRYFPIENIPPVQEKILKINNKLKKQTYVATNLLETMIKDNKPTRAESHDVYATLKQGAKGLVLAAETAIGIDPVNCVKFLKKSIKIYKKNRYKI